VCDRIRDILVPDKDERARCAAQAKQDRTLEERGDLVSHRRTEHRADAEHELGKGGLARST
jgi:hypothetical protein